MSLLSVFHLVTGWLSRVLEAEPAPEDRTVPGVDRAEASDRACDKENLIASLMVHAPIH